MDSKLAEMLKGLPALMILGPRAVGKTTTAARLAAHVMYLEDPSTAAMVNADPGGALRGLPEPVLLDEWQEAPDLLAAVKRSVDADRRPGRYLLTGSVRAHLSNRVWPGTRPGDSGGHVSHDRRRDHGQEHQAPSGPALGG